MFTGIVEELGTIVGRDDLTDAARLTIRGPRVTSDAGFGDSIAVNGVCLTVVEFDDQQFTVDVMAETLRRSSLDRLGLGSSVNLERAMRADGRFGGHIVQGHVDGTGTVVAITPSQNWTVVRIGVDPHLSRYLVEKGSITVDGVSLTVSAIGAGSEASGPGEIGAGSEASGPGDWFEISLIPTTLQETTLGSASVGAVVNLEVDVLAKYVERLQATRAESIRTQNTAGTAEVK
ncbi:riboflavin synthase alpha chain [Gordonia polyisoprenivorans NBRC 16320 = JCM 10675]|uniref:Riboflavin synthase n=1 Tax=Gordonia polyisoprenivorans TaxID=84595 RepID=A0A846WKQ2_9ACTN|nr:riboflavin synthase [Gordonia polyisoprenivorans]NKY02264.1 riboflavin synthase [Gordonia polyisoprenivorans]UZF58737.1 riboflavin synthase [Gordonia polyisoprenivorans]GAB23639.1 riboflavin synthase alpha chain [Gordonia polyisoprenivorans NBRC 16320 = JCM 10675]